MMSQCKDVPSDPAALQHDGALSSFGLFGATSEG